MESGGKRRVGRIRKASLREAAFELVLRGKQNVLQRCDPGPCPHVLTFSKWFKPLLSLPMISSHDVACALGLQ